VGFEPACNWIVLNVIPDETCASDDLLYGYVKYATTRIEHIDVGQWVKDVSLHSTPQDVSNVRGVKYAEKCYQDLERTFPEPYFVA